MLQLLGHPESDIRAAASHCFANLVWETEDSGSDTERMSRLLSVGVKERLEELQKDELIDSKTHIAKALERLNTIN